MRFLPYRSIISASVSITIAASVAFLQANAACAQSLSRWKTITSTFAGVSFLLPPGAKVEPSTSGDPKTGAKYVMLFASQTDDRQSYNVSVTLVNKAAIDSLRLSPPGNELIEALGKNITGELISDAEQSAKVDPKHTSFTRKPIVWLGMKSEEIVLLKQGKDSKENRYMRIRIAKDSTHYIALIATETDKSPNSDLRMQKFFESFRILPGDPLAKK